MKHYPTLVTHLAMRAPFLAHGLPTALPSGIKLDYQPVMSPSCYRTLYDAVGRQWHWVNRRGMNEQKLTALIHHPSTEIYTLCDKGQMVGFIELNFKEFPQVEIVFIGLMQDYIGRGLGSVMLAHALEIIYAKSPIRIIIQTCTLDHPSALYLYKKAGFMPYMHKEVIIIDRAS